MMRQNYHSGRAAIATSRALAMALALAVAGCSGGLAKKGIGGPTVTQVDSAELPSPTGQIGSGQVYRYTIGPFDKLVVDVMAFSELSDRRITVDGSGNIALPVGGVVNVGGLSLAEAAYKITDQLRAHHVRDPQVAVNLEESVSSYLTVEGEVKQPGNYPVLPGLTLMRAVAAAKGTTDFSSLREVVVHRSVNGRQMIALYDLSAIRRGAYGDPVLFPKDIVVVGDSPSKRLFQNIIAVSPLFVSPLIAVLDNR